MVMKETTLCYIRHQGKTLMMHRIRKQNDENEGKWVGIGGKLEPGESPETCLLREVREETALTLDSWEYRGIVDFVSDRWEEEYMHLFTAEVSAPGPLPDCDEGVLSWVENGKLSSLPMWEGDRVFFDLLDAGSPFFRLRLEYRGEALISHRLLGEEEFWGGNHGTVSDH